MRIHDQRALKDPCLWASPHNVTVIDALAEVFIGGVVRKPFELVLDRLRQVRVLHHRILGFFVCEIGIKVGHVEYRFL